MLRSRSTVSVESLLRTLYGPGDDAQSSEWPLDASSCTALSSDLELAVSHGSRVCTVVFSDAEEGGGPPRGAGRVYSDGVRVLPRFDDDLRVTALAWIMPGHLCVCYQSGTVRVFRQGIPTMAQRFARSPVLQAAVFNPRNNGSKTSSLSSSSTSSSSSSASSSSSSSASASPSFSFSSSSGGDLWITHRNGVVVQIRVQELVSLSTRVAASSPQKGGGGGGDRGTWTEPPPHVLWQAPVRHNDGGQREIVDAAVVAPHTAPLFEPAPDKNVLFVLLAGADPPLILCEARPPREEKANVQKLATAVASKVMSGATSLASNAWGSILSRTFGQPKVQWREGEGEGEIETERETERQSALVVLGRHG